MARIRLNENKLRRIIRALTEGDVLQFPQRKRKIPIMITIKSHADTQVGNVAAILTSILDDVAEQININDLYSHLFEFVKTDSSLINSDIFGASGKLSLVLQHQDEKTKKMIYNAKLTATTEMDIDEQKIKDIFIDDLQSNESFSNSFSILLRKKLSESV